MPVALNRDGAGVSSIVAGMAEGEAAEGTITLSFRLRSAGNSSLSTVTCRQCCTYMVHRALRSSVHSSGVQSGGQSAYMQCCAIKQATGANFSFIAVEE